MTDTLTANLAALPPDQLAYLDWQMRWTSTARGAVSKQRPATSVVPAEQTASWESTLSAFVALFTFRLDSRLLIRLFACFLASFLTCLFSFLSSFASPACGPATAVPAIAATRARTATASAAWGRPFQIRLMRHLPSAPGHCNPMPHAAPALRLG